MAASSAMRIGNPSGVLVDKAMDLVDAVVPPPTDDQRRAALQAALAHMNSVGLTGVGDAGDDGQRHRALPAIWPIRANSRCALRHDSRTPVRTSRRCRRRDR